MNDLALFVKKYVKLREYTNVVDVSHWSRLIRKFTGSAVHEVKITDNRAKVRFSFFGFFFFVFWSALYIFSAYTAQVEDQTILRNLYSTKLRRYGDDFERISSFTYVLLTMWFIPFRISGNYHIMQIMIDLDKLIEDMGDNLDYNRYARTTFLITVSQVGVYLFRMLCIWFPINNANESMPYEKMFQVVYSDAQAMILTSIYCYGHIILRDRFRWINKVLKEVEMRSSWEYKVFSRGKMTPNIVKVIPIQERHIVEKIKICARVYSMLYNICDKENELFGFAVLITLLHYFNYIILYLFYFMEVTASGLFHDVKRYIDFLVYGFWEVAIALGIIFLIVYFSESVVKEAKKTSFIIHEIINGDFSAEINNEAMQLSVQLLHEKPTFTVLGLFDLNYALLQQSPMLCPMKRTKSIIAFSLHTWNFMYLHISFGARSVSTYLVVLLQFATENSHGESTLK